MMMERFTTSDFIVPPQLDRGPRISNAADRIADAQGALTRNESTDNDRPKLPHGMRQFVRCPRPYRIVVPSLRLPVSYGRRIKLRGMELDADCAAQAGTHSVSDTDAGLDVPLKIQTLSPAAFRRYVPSIGPILRTNIGSLGSRSVRALFRKTPKKFISE